VLSNSVSALPLTLENNATLSGINFIRSGVSSTITVAASGDMRFNPGGSPNMMYLSGSTGNVQVGGAFPATSKMTIQASSAGNTDRGVLALGTGVFDATGPAFLGSAQGTALAVNMAAGFNGDFLNFEVASLKSIAPAKCPRPEALPPTDKLLPTPGRRAVRPTVLETIPIPVCSKADRRLDSRLTEAKSST
jgi:hypothetical protein